MKGYKNVGLSKQPSLIIRDKRKFMMQMHLRVKQRFG